jgi:hypothetical protein
MGDAEKNKYGEKVSRIKLSYLHLPRTRSY